MPRARARPPRADIYRLVDSEPDIAVVRCFDEDGEKFWALVADNAREDGWLDSTVPDEDMGKDPVADEEWLAFVRLHVQPPVWRWFRKNPAGVYDRDEGYTWMLGYPKQRGPGNWRGALVRLVERKEASDGV